MKIQYPRQKFHCRGLTADLDTQKISELEYTNIETIQTEAKRGKRLKMYYIEVKFI